MTTPAWTEEIAAFAVEAVTARDPDALTAAFQAIVGRYGMTGFACGEIDLRDLRRSVMVASDWPAEWMEFYGRERLFEHDPAITAIRRGSGALSWNAVTERVRHDPKVRRSLQAAESFGWREGVFLPIPRGGSRFGLATLCGTATGLSPVDRDGLGVALLLFYERLRGLLAGRPPARAFSGLTPRELDCLALVARGCGDQAIADRLKIARSTAHDHVERAKRRLRVRTRAEAVAIAVSMGLVAL